MAMHMDEGDSGGILYVPSDHLWGMVALVAAPLVAWLVVCAVQALARQNIAWASAVSGRLAVLSTAAKAALFASYVGAVVHVVLVQPHWEEDRGRAVLFLADAAGFAVAFGWAFLQRPYWRAASLLMAAATVGGYAYYVLRGWEEVDLVGLVTTTVELAVALILVVPDSNAAASLVRIRERWVVGISLPLALLSVLGTSAIATATQDPQDAHSESAEAAVHTPADAGHEGTQQMPGMDMSGGSTGGTGLPLSLATKSPAGPITWPVSMAHMEAGMTMVTPHCTDRPTAAQQLAAVRLVNQTVQAAAPYRSLAAAKAAGYVPVTPTGLKVVHYINYSSYLEGSVLDPSSIPVLVYVNTQHGAVLSAAMYMAPSTAPSQPGGCLTQWHEHTNLCFADAAVVGLSDQGAGCPQGSVRQVTQPMMHVWLTPVQGGPLSPDPSTLSELVAAEKVPPLARPNGTA